MPKLLVYLSDDKEDLNPIVPFVELSFFHNNNLSYRKSLGTRRVEVDDNLWKLIKLAKFTAELSETIQSSFNAGIKYGIEYALAHPHHIEDEIIESSTE